MDTVCYFACSLQISQLYSERLLLQCYKYFPCCVPVSLMVVPNNSCKNVDRQKNNSSCLGS